MRGMYTARVSIATITTGRVGLHCVADSTHAIEIYKAQITCSDEDTSEQMLCELNRVATAGTPSGDPLTPKPSEEGASAAASTWLSDLSADPTAYDSTGNAMAHFGANKLGGWLFEPQPEDRPVIAPSDIFVLRTIDTLVNSSNLIFEVTFREIG